jgi:uncharacterized membrane protein (DUF106 family)
MGRAPFWFIVVLGLLTAYCFVLVVYRFTEYKRATGLRKALGLRA